MANVTDDDVQRCGGCGRELPATSGRGRRRQYCDDVVLRILDDTGQVDPWRTASLVCQQCAPIGAALLAQHGRFSVQQPVREWLDEQRDTHRMFA